MGQTNGSFVDEGDLAMRGDSARLDLDDGFIVSAVDRRVARRIPLVKERELDIELLERMGACDCVCEVGGSDGEIPAKVVTEVALSMYFSIRRSLFQLKYRNNSDAVLSYNNGKGSMSATYGADDVDSHLHRRCR